MQVIVDRIRTTLPAVNDDILGYITGLEYLIFSILSSNFSFFFLDILETNRTDYLDFQEVEDALRPILEEVAHDQIEQEAITELCQFVCDQLRL
jgi:hypothetical protein